MLGTEEQQAAESCAKTVLSAHRSLLPVYYIVVIGVSMLVALPLAVERQSEWKRITPGRRSSATMTNQHEEPRPTRAVRLIFEYEGDRVRLVSEQPVDVAVTGFDLPQSTDPGYYVEARTTDNRTMARVPARGAFAGSMEVFPEKPGDPITRIDAAQPRGAFTVVVPAPEPASQVTLVRLQRPAEGAARGTALPSAEVVDLVSFPLTAGR
jgi:hypothetical protein